MYSNLYRAAVVKWWRTFVEINWCQIGRGFRVCHFKGIIRHIQISLEQEKCFQFIDSSPQLIMIAAISVVSLEKYVKKTLNVLLHIYLN